MVLIAFSQICITRAQASQYIAMAPAAGNAAESISLVFYRPREFELADARPTWSSRQHGTRSHGDLISSITSFMIIELRKSKHAS
jgi:hypothetical protein